MLGLNKCPGLLTFNNQTQKLLKCRVSAGAAPWARRDFGKQKKGEVSSWAGGGSRSCLWFNRDCIYENGNWAQAIETLGCASKCGISIYILRVSTISPLFLWGSPCQEKPIVNFWFKDSAVLRSRTFCCFNVFLAAYILSPTGLPCKYYTNVVKSWTASLVFLSSL